MLGHVRRTDFHPGLQKLGDKGEGTGEPIQSRDQKDALGSATLSQGCGQFGAILLRPALDLGEGALDRISDTSGVLLHRFPLCLKP